MAILESPARETLIGALRQARATGSRIAFDPNYRPRLWTSPEEARAANDAALAVTDIALPTFPDEQQLYGDAGPRETTARLARAGVRECIVKNGSEPTVLAAGCETATVSACRVTHPVDTTGAGDSFNGAYLAARLAGDAPQDAVRRAHRVAAAVIQVHGALAPFEVLREAFKTEM